MLNILCEKLQHSKDWYEETAYEYSLNHNIPKYRVEDNLMIYNDIDVINRDSVDVEHQIDLDTGKEIRITFILKSNVL